MHQALQIQVARLEAVFRDIAATRMEGVPLLHASLQVQAVDFAPEPEGDFALGVLVTPWFMNLMRLPLGAAQVLAPGQVGPQRLGEPPSAAAVQVEVIAEFQAALKVYPQKADVQAALKSARESAHKEAVQKALELAGK